MTEFTHTPKKSADIPATKEMLDSFRAELKSDNTDLKLQMKALDAKFESKFSGLDSKFANIDSKFLNIDSQFANLGSKMEHLISLYHKGDAEKEEQNSRNRFVLDGYTNLYDQIKDLEETKADKIDTPTIFQK